MLTLYKYPFQSRAERIVWILAELGYEYETKVINPMQGENRSVEFLAINPNAKVPALVKDGKCYTESLAIMEYLNDLHPEQPLSPKDPEDNYKFRQALSFGMTEIEAYVWLMAQATLLNGLYQWQDGVADNAKAHFEKALPIVYQWLEQREYIAGSTFTFADIYYHSLLRWLERMANLDLPKSVQQYLQKLEQREFFPKLD